MSLYKINRFVENGKTLTVATDLTLEQAQAWCSDPNSSSRTATDPIGPIPEGRWFDGYTDQDPSDEVLEERAERDRNLLAACNAVEDLIHGR